MEEEVVVVVDDDDDMAGNIDDVVDAVAAPSPRGS